MTEENRQEIQIPGGMVRLKEGVQFEEGPSPQMQERVRRDFEHRQAIAEGEEKLRAEHKEREREAAFADALEEHIEDRRRFHALRGVPESVFEADLRPEIERKFVAGEQDAVEIERQRRAASPY